MRLTAMKVKTRDRTMREIMRTTSAEYRLDGGEVYHRIQAPAMHSALDICVSTPHDVDYCLILPQVRRGGREPARNRLPLGPQPATMLVPVRVVPL